MNKLRLTILFLISSMLFVPLASTARDTVGDYSIEDALDQYTEKADLGNEILFYFGEQPHGNVKKSLGEFRTNKKTNAFGKSDQRACQWVFNSALKSLRDRAISEGGNAVINITSNYKNNQTSSDTTFQCGAGGIMAGVALIGTVIILK